MQNALRYYAVKFELHDLLQQAHLRAQIEEAVVHRQGDNPSFRRVSMMRSAMPLSTCMRYSPASEKNHLWIPAWRRSIGSRSGWT